MESNYKTVDLQFSYNDGRIISQVQKGVEVLEREYEEDSVRLKIRGSQSRISKIMTLIN